MDKEKDEKNLTEEEKIPVRESDLKTQDAEKNESEKNLHEESDPEPEIETAAEEAAAATTSQPAGNTAEAMRPESGDTSEKEKAEKEELRQSEDSVSMMKLRAADIQKVIESSEASEDEMKGALAILRECFSESGDRESVRKVGENLLKAARFEKAIESARQAGEIAGRNAAIEAELLKGESGDGLPQMGARTVGLRETQPGRSIFDLAGYAR